MRGRGAKREWESESGKGIGSRRACRAIPRIFIPWAGTDLALGKEEGRLEGLPEGPFLDVAAAMESIRTII